MENYTGTTISSRYVIESVIGEGGMGVVYKGSDTLEQRPVAVKVLKDAELLSRVENSVRLKREAAILGRLRHDGIVRVFDFARDGECHYLVMEFVDGESLQSSLFDRGRYSIDDVLRLVRDVGKTLSFIHEQGIVHGDIKPGNILIERTRGDGSRLSTKLCDFGLSRYIRRNEQLRISGTYCFMSPEQLGIIRVPVDFRTDLYALGVIFYTLLTGRLPYVAGTLHEHVSAVSTLVPPAPSSLNPAVPEVVDMVLARLVCRDPESRYSTAAGLCSDLDAIIERKTIDRLCWDDTGRKLQYHTRYIGRMEQIETLYRLFFDAARGAGSVCMISGDPGSGKSRLIDEMSGWATAHSALCFHSTCLARENQVPYHLFADILSQYVTFASSLPQPQRTGLLDNLQRSAGPLCGLLVKLNPFFAGIFPDVPAVVPLDAHKEHLRFINLCASVLASLGTAQRPVVLFFDDLQWSDAGSMEIFYDLWLRIAPLPLLIVGAYRSGELHPNHPVEICTRKALLADLPMTGLTLNRFTMEETHGYLQALLRNDEPWVARCAEYVTGKSDGNPLAAMELIRQLVAAGILYWEDGCWKCAAGRFDHPGLPDELARSVLSRIVATDNNLLEILSIAALCGKRFGIELILRLVDFVSREMVVEHLETAAGFDLVVWDNQVQGTLYFIHDTIRDIFLQRLSPEQKKKHHLLIAETLEKGPQSPDSDTLLQMVHHFYHAERFDRCLPYALQAAEMARAALAVDSAIYYYELVLRLAGGAVSQRIFDGWRPAAEGLIELYPLAGNVSKAVELAEQCIAASTSAVEKARYHRIIGVNLTKISSFEKAERHFAVALKLCGRRIPGTRFAALLSSLLQYLIHLLVKTVVPLRSSGKKRTVTQKAHEIVAIYQGLSQLYILCNYLKYFWVTVTLMNYARRKTGPSPELAAAVSSYAMILMGIPWIGRCRFHHDRALAINELIGNKPGIAETHNYLGFAYCIPADWETALHFTLLAKAEYEAIGDHFQLVHVLNCLQNIYYLQGDAQRRLPVLKALLSLSESIGNRYGACIALSGIGGHYYMTGEFGLSEQFLDRAIEQGCAAEVWLVVCVASTVKARLMLDMGRIDAAEEAINAADETQRTHSLLKPVIALKYITGVQVALARYTAERATQTSAEKRQMERNLAAKVRLMLVTTRRWQLWNADAQAMLARYLVCIGHDVRAEKTYQRAVMLLTRRGKLFELALCRYHYGLFLDAHGRNAEAETVLTKALTLFSEIGARYYIGCIEARISINTDTGALAEHEDTQRLAALIAVSRSIGDGKGIDRLLDEILGRAIGVTGASRGIFFVVDETGGLSVSSLKSIDNASEMFRFSGNIAEEVRKTGQTVITANAAQQDAYSRFESVIGNDLKSIICAPVKWQGKVLGVCYLDNPVSVGVFGAKDREMLEALMNHAAISIENARAFGELQRHNERLSNERNQAVKRSDELRKIVEFNTNHVRSFGELRLVTQDGTMAELIQTAKRYADSNASVLITGESGSGKEVFAHLIHHAGKRRNGPFIKVNCSAIPETLFEAEFFGYERGAFTGATSSRQGKFELADGGTLMLDEVAELPPAQQAKLLRVLEEQEVTPVGARTSRKIDVRIIAATNMDIKTLIGQNRFREDLFFRISILHIAVPPLSSRLDDIPVLASYFLSQIANDEGGREKKFDDAALFFLRSMPLPGNVRQLRSLVYRLYVLFDKDTLGREDVQSVANEPSDGENTDMGRDSFILTDAFARRTMPFGKVKELFERQYLSEQLALHGANVTRTAQALSLQPSALSRKLKELGITVQRSQTVPPRPASSRDRKL